jgi:WS/DGAT C-terminal domain
VPLAMHQGLNVGIMSYDGQVNFGLIGDFDAIPDLDALASDLETSLGNLFSAAGGRRGAFRRFIPGAERRAEEVARQNGGDGGEREGSPAG